MLQVASYNAHPAPISPSILTAPTTTTTTNWTSNLKVTYPVNVWYLGHNLTASQEIVEYRNVEVNLNENV